MIHVVIEGLTNMNVIKMVNELENIAYGEMPEWGQTSRFLINSKRKLSLSVKHTKVSN